VVGPLLPFFLDTAQWRSTTSTPLVEILALLEHSWSQRFTVRRLVSINCLKARRAAWVTTVFTVGHSLGRAVRRRRRAAAADILLTPPPPIVTYRRAAAAAADHMSASRRRRFRGVLTSCRTPAIMLLDFCNAVYNEA